MKVTKIILREGIDYCDGHPYETAFVMCASFTEFWFGSSLPPKIQVTVSTEQFKNKAKQLRVRFSRNFDSYFTSVAEGAYVYYRTREILSEKFAKLKNRTFWVQMRKVK